MNLLIDPWVPVQNAGKTTLIGLQDVLTSDENHQIVLPRDDMELACLQLLICLTQVLFLPEDSGAWKRRIKTPLDADGYIAGIERYIDWFDLNHPEWPFMQTRRVSAKEITPIQKLFIGLPEGNNHSFFNDPGEIECVGLAAAAIALFNQAMNAPSFGGGFKSGFRGGAPITTFMSCDSLRHTIWFNVLHRQSLLKIMPSYEKLEEDDKPVWVEPIKPKSNISADHIGLMRGLFWQPAHVELCIVDQKAFCGLTGLPADYSVVGFRKEKFGNVSTGGFEVTGTWLHPHSPWRVDIRNQTTRFLSFANTDPAWTLLNNFLVQYEDARQSHSPASVVKQYRSDLASPVHIIVAGYKTAKRKQALVEQRRHELIPISLGWEGDINFILAVTQMGLDIMRSFKSVLFKFGEDVGVAKEKPKKQQNRSLPKEDNHEGMHVLAVQTFFRQSEQPIYRCLTEVGSPLTGVSVRNLANELTEICWRIFEQVTRPYAHDPRMIKALAVARITLGSAFEKLKET